MVRAIRANKVNMPKCAQQITERFLEILQKAEALPWDGSAEETPGQTAMDGAPGPDEGEVGYEDATTEEDSKARSLASDVRTQNMGICDSTPISRKLRALPFHHLLRNCFRKFLHCNCREGVSDNSKSLTAIATKVHRLALLLFAELQQQGTAAAALEQAAVAICNAEVGSLKARRCRVPVMRACTSSRNLEVTLVDRASESAFAGFSPSEISLPLRAIVECYVRLEEPWHQQSCTPA